MIRMTIESPTTSSKCKTVNYNEYNSISRDRKNGQVINCNTEYGYQELTQLNLDYKCETVSFAKTINKSVWKLHCHAANLERYWKSQSSNENFVEAIDNYVEVCNEWNDPVSQQTATPSAQRTDNWSLRTNQHR